MPSGVRAWAPLVLASVLAALLLALAVLQWRWLGQISADERERMQTSLRTQVGQFTQEFDRELTRAYFWLQADRGAAPGGVAAIASTGHFQRWFASAPHPDLVRAIYVLSIPEDDTPTTAGIAVSVYDKDREALVPTRDYPEAVAAVVARLVAEPEARAERGPGAAVLPPVVAEGPALLIPRPPVPIVNAGGAIVFSRGERPWDYTVAVLDEDFIRTTFLPDLLRRHFGEDGASSYRVSVTNRATSARVFCSDADPGRCDIASPDATEDLFEIRMREFNRFVVVDDRRGAQNRAPAVAPLAPAASAASPSAPSAGQAMPPRAGSPEPRRRDLTVSIVRGSEGEPRRPDREPLWRADFAHQAGSLEAVVASTRRRNLFISSSVLLLLGASIGMLVVSNARARKLAAQQMEFVAGVSHELRTPLAVIRSAAENLADGVVADREQVQRYGQLIAGEGRRLTEMVEQVMEFAGFDAGRTLDVRAVAAADVVQAAIEASGPLVAETDSRVDVDAPATPLLVRANHAALVRSVQNLISNAIKYGGRDRWVGVRIAPADGRMVAISVSDHGSGIPEPELARIFEPFYRGQEALDGQVHGSGLGLSLVERIVRQHDGRVDVRSTPRGTTFTLVIPSASESTAAASVEASIATADARLEGRGHAS